MTREINVSIQGNLEHAEVPPRQQGLYDPWFEHEACGVGFVVDVKGRKSHQIIRQGLSILINLNHRGACGCETNTGDGAGILIQMPHTFLKEACRDARVKLPGRGEYGAGLVFLPQEPGERQRCERLFQAMENLRLNNL